MKMLNHQNIVQFKEVFKDNKNRLNLVKEYADGSRMSQMILKRREDNNPFSEDEIFNYFTQICLALKHCHDRNIRYCLIKSGYIYITSQGLCKLDDFSYSEIIDSVDHSNLL